MSDSQNIKPEGEEAQLLGPDSPSDVVADGDLAPQAGYEGNGVGDDATPVPDVGEEGRAIEGGQVSSFAPRLGVFAAVGDGEIEVGEAASEEESENPEGPAAGEQHADVGEHPGQSQSENDALGVVDSAIAQEQAQISAGIGFIYHLAYPCKAKKRASFIEMVAVLAADEGMEAFVESLQQNELSDADPNPVVRRIVGLQGYEEVSVSQIDVLRRGEMMLRFRRKCRDCPANFGSPKTGFGCVGFIPTPICEEGEKVLMVTIERLMSSEEVDASAAAPMRHIWDNGLDGQTVQAMRDTRVFANGEAITTRVGPFLDKRPISSDQVLELFLCRESISLEYMLMFQPFFHEFDRLLPVERLGREAVAPLARYFRALMLATDLEVAVQLSPHFLKPDKGSRKKVEAVQVSS